MACGMCIFTSPFLWNGSPFFICLASAVFGSPFDLLEENSGFSVCFSSWRCSLWFGLICPIQPLACRMGRCFRSSFSWLHFSWPGLPNNRRFDRGLKSDSRGEAAITPWRQGNFNHRFHRLHRFEERVSVALVARRCFPLRVNSMRRCQTSRQATFPSHLQICVICAICG
jgi:hypothetical protein